MPGAYELSRPLDRLALTMVPRETAADAAHEAIFGLQHREPEEVAIGLAVAFHAVVHKCGLDPQELHAMGGKVLRDQEGSLKTNASLQSLRDWASIRVLGRDTPVS